MMIWDTLIDLLKLSVYVGSALLILFFAFVGRALFESLELFGGKIDRIVGSALGGLGGLLIASIVFGAIAVLFAIRHHLEKIEEHLDALSKTETP